MEQVSVGAARREARKAARAAATQKASAQERAIVKAPATRVSTAASTASAAEASAASAPAEVVHAPAPKHHKVVQAEARKAAAVQADQQERAIVQVASQQAPSPAEFRVQPGQPVPLAVLNEIGRRHGSVARDRARQVAKAAGDAAFHAVSGRTPDDLSAKLRHTKQRDADAAMDLARKAAEARRAAATGNE